MEYVDSLDCEDWLWNLRLWENQGKDLSSSSSTAWFFWLNDAPRRCVSCQIAVPPSVLPSGLGKVLTSIGGSHSSIPQSSSHVPSALTMGHAQERQGGAVVRDTNSGARLSWPHQLPAE